MFVRGNKQFFKQLNYSFSLLFNNEYLISLTGEQHFTCEGSFINIISLSNDRF